MEPMSRKLNTLNMRRAGGEQVKFYPYEKGGGGGGKQQLLAMLKGMEEGRKGFGSVFL